MRKNIFFTLLFLSMTVSSIAQRNVAGKWYMPNESGKDWAFRKDVPTDFDVYEFTPFGEGTITRRKQENNVVKIVTIPFSGFAWEDNLRLSYVPKNVAFHVENVSNSQLGYGEASLRIMERSARKEYLKTKPNKEEKIIFTILNRDSKFLTLTDGTDTLKLFSDEGKESARIKAYDDLYKDAYVDLGLPSGTLWAVRNVGALSPTDPGDYFAWGDPIGRYSDNKECFDAEHTRYCIDTKANNEKYSKYVINKEGGIVDNKYELEPCDDAACVKWGKNWQTPSIEQLRELIEHTTMQKELVKRMYPNDNEQLYIVILTSKINGKSITIPCGGYWNFYDRGHKDDAYYWTRSLSSEDVYLGRGKIKGDYLNAWHFDSSNSATRFGWVDSSKFKNIWFGSRHAGFNVRPVRVKK